jgi:hypothetical protein
MIEICDLLPDESLNDTVSSDTSCSSPVTDVVRAPCSPKDIRYNSSNIKLLLKEQPMRYTLVDNNRMNHVKPSPCWNRFALPAIKDENNRTIVIRNFATCKSCYATYKYSYGSTKSLNSHKCPKEQLAASDFKSSK